MIKYEDDIDLTAGDAASFVYFTTHLRADLHRYRTSPEQDASPLKPQYVLNAQDSQCNFNNTGTLNGGSSTITYSGSGTLPIIVSGTLPPSYCVVDGMIDSEAKTLAIAPFAFAKNGTTATIAGLPPSTFDLFTQTFLLRESSAPTPMA